MDYLLGSMAALGASLVFSATSTLFTLAGRAYGASLVLLISLPMGTVCLMLIHWLMFGQPLPLGNSEGWLWLGLSGMMGLWLGSVLVVNAFILLGPRITLLIMASSPILSGILAWFAFDERLESDAIFGIVLTIGGIMWVVAEKNANRKNNLTAQQYRLGLLFAIGATLGQTFSFVFSRQGLDTGVEPMSAAVIRTLAGAIGIWSYAILQGQAASNIDKITRHPVALRQVLVGTITGPVVGASLVLVGLNNAPVGVASTLANLMPLFLIPISYVVFREHITRRAIFGTIVAIMGIAILLL